MTHIYLHLTNEDIEPCKQNEKGNVGLWIDNDCIATWKPTELNDDVPMWLVMKAFNEVFNEGKKARSKELKQLIG